MIASEQTKSPAKLPFMGWALVTLLAVGIGLGALRYALPHVPFPALLTNFSARHNWLVAHAVFSALALIAGPWQFLPALRRRALKVHRWTGRIYCGAVCAGWLASLPIASHAQTGQVASVGFLTLGALWIGTTATGYVMARRRQWSAHRAWMMRSYALTAAAITLRLYLPVLLMAGVPFTTTYPLVAWLSWIPNLGFAEWLLRRGQTRIVATPSLLTLS